MLETEPGTDLHSLVSLSVLPPPMPCSHSGSVSPASKSMSYCSAIQGRWQDSLLYTTGLNVSWYRALVGSVLSSSAKATTEQPRKRLFTNFMVNWYDPYFMMICGMRMVNLLNVNLPCLLCSLRFPRCIIFQNSDLAYEAIILSSINIFNIVPNVSIVY